MTLEVAATLLWIAVAVLFPATVFADAEANCTFQQYNWMFNSQGFSPCHIAGQLFSPCYGTAVVYTPLTAGNQFYVGDSSNACGCSTVVYSLLSACSTCQGGIIERWSSTASKCASTSMATFPKPFPDGVRVPNWAFLTIAPNYGLFDVFAASSAGGGDLTTNPPRTSTIPADSSTPAAPPSTSTSTSTPTPPSAVTPQGPSSISGTTRPSSQDVPSSISGTTKPSSQDVPSSVAGTSSSPSLITPRSSIQIGTGSKSSTSSGHSITASASTSTSNPPSTVPPISNIPAIAGAVVGGLGGLALLGALLFVFVLRRKFLRPLPNPEQVVTPMISRGGNPSAHELGAPEFPPAYVKN